MSLILTLDMNIIMKLLRACLFNIIIAIVKEKLITFLLNITNAIKADHFLYNT